MYLQYSPPYPFEEYQRLRSINPKDWFYPNLRATIDRFYTPGSYAQKVLLACNIAELYADTWYSFRFEYIRQYCDTAVALCLLQLVYMQERPEVDHDNDLWVRLLLKVLHLVEKIEGKTERYNILYDAYAKLYKIAEEERANRFVVIRL